MEKSTKAVANMDVTVDEEVFCSIASICASEITGIAAMSENLMDGMAKLLRSAPSHKGIRVAVNGAERTVTVEISVVVEQGESIPMIAESLQNSVKETIEKMTNYEVTAVNVNIAGVEWKQDALKTTETEEEPQQ